MPGNARDSTRNRSSVIDEIRLGGVASGAYGLPTARGLHSTTGAGMMWSKQAQFAYLRAGWRHAAAITFAALMVLPEVAFAVVGQDSGVDCDAPNVICGQREGGDIAAGGLGPGHGGGYTAPGAVPGAGAGGSPPPVQCATKAQNNSVMSRSDDRARRTAAGEAVLRYNQTCRASGNCVPLARGDRITVIYGDGGAQTWTVAAVIPGPSSMNAVDPTPVTQPSPPVPAVAAQCP